MAEVLSLDGKVPFPSGFADAFVTWLVQPLQEDPMDVAQARAACIWAADLRLDDPALRTFKNEFLAKYGDKKEAVLRALGKVVGFAWPEDGIWAAERNQRRLIAIFLGICSVTQQDEQLRFYQAARYAGISRELVASQIYPSTDPPRDASIQVGVEPSPPPRVPLFEPPPGLTHDYHKLPTRSDYHPPVPKHLRTHLWELYYGNVLKEKCCICRIPTIDVNSAHLACDVAVAKGGTSDPRARVPVCAQCNLAMSTLSFEAFMQRWNLGHGSDELFQSKFSVLQLQMDSTVIDDLRAENRSLHQKIQDLEKLVRATSCQSPVMASYTGKPKPRHDIDSSDDEFCWAPGAWDPISKSRRRSIVKGFKNQVTMPCLRKKLNRDAAESEALIDLINDELKKDSPQTNSSFILKTRKRLRFLHNKAVKGETYAMSVHHEWKADMTADDIRQIEDRVAVKGKAGPSLATKTLEENILGVSTLLEVPSVGELTAQQ